LKFGAETSIGEYERMIELFRAAKILAKSTDLDLAKLKLKDIFPIEMLVPIHEYL
jgi:hypothetical protein